MGKSFSMRQYPGRIVLRLHEDLDAAGADELDRALAAAVERGQGQMVVDMSEVHLITSTALGVLVTAYKRLKSAGRRLELIHLHPDVHNVFLMTGLNTLIRVREYAGGVHDLLQRTDDETAAAMANARTYLAGMLAAVGIDDAPATTALDEIFRLCTTPRPPHQTESDLQRLVQEMDLPQRLADSLADRPAGLRRRIGPFLPDGWSVLLVPGSDGRLGEALSDAHSVQLLDVLDENHSDLSLQCYDGIRVPFPDKSFEATVATNVLHACDDPAAALRELMRVTRNRIVLTETIYLNETQRRFNVFIDWFYRTIIHSREHTACNFRKPKQWQEMFRTERLAVKASIDIGLDQGTIPEYHWMYVLDVPANRPIPQA